jgi:hypothetical protein
MDWIKLHGTKVAKYFAKTGRFIFAIKHIECANPGISREDAKAAVGSFGLGYKNAWSENERHQFRVL